MKRRKLKNPKNRKPPFKREEFVGIVRMTREGYAFIDVDDKDQDIFVSAPKLRGALNSDKVRVITTKAKGLSVDGKPKRIEGEVLAIIERSKIPHIGILQVTRSEVWVIMESRVMPYDIRIDFEELKRFFPERGDNPAHYKSLSGLKVAVLVKEWPRRAMAPIGELIDVLGEPGENDTEMHAILAEYGLPYRFAPKVEEEANSISEEISKAEIERRRDMRDVTTFTIDPTDAKDFDDAISYQILPNGNTEIGVHIADVTHYVKPGSLIDKVAYERGTSVYLVDRTIPMLPEKLSNNLCSLRPNEDKLCFSAIFELNEKGGVVNEWFGRTIIHSNVRFDYEEAQKIIETGEGLLSKEISDIYRLANILRQQRFKSGAINFERPEMKVKVDEMGKPIDVYEKIGKEANWLIEEFMLLANKRVAQFIGKPKKKGDKVKTFVYRIHEEPTADKLMALRKFVHLFGYNLANNEEGGKKRGMNPLNKLLKDAKGSPEEETIGMMALRSMARARYSTDNLGHYGLAFDYYSHFTSPIRRYPDMLAHRLLSHYLDLGASVKKDEYEAMCKHCSEREQIATEAERASIKYKLVEFMQDKVGQIFDGTISGLTEWGMYVEIEPTKVEGMIPLREIKTDYFTFDEERYCIIGKGTHKKYTLGDKVKIKVVRASLEQKIIDYALINDLT